MRRSVWTKVIANGRTFRAGMSLVLGLIWTSAALGDGPLFPGAQYHAGHTPESVAIGDLNGDQVPDLTVANEVSDTFGVLLGLGDGTFAAGMHFSADDGPVSIAIGYLNGDQVPDLAVANLNSDNVSVVVGVGDGTFVAAAHYAVGDGPRSVAIGDLDGDHVPELAVANVGSGNVSVLLGIGDGTFAAAAHYAAGNASFSVAIGDLDRDGMPDLVVVKPQSGTISVLFNQSECNGSGIPDECDIDCGPPGGPCDLPGCGQSEDCNGNRVPDDCEVDGDGDGFIDDCDACLDSDLAKLIVLNECPPGVPNQLLGDGCTMNDVLSECSLGAHSHGELTACVARHADEWRRQGLLSAKDVGRIAHCAGTSNERRPSKRTKDIARGGR